MTAAISRDARLRDRARRAEERCAGLAQELDRAVRWLSILSLIAGGREGAVQLLWIVEEIDDREPTRAKWTPAAAAELLRETDPARTRTAA